jgi:hypothetical protein
VGITSAGCCLFGCSSLTEETRPRKQQMAKGREKASGKLVEEADLKLFPTSRQKKEWSRCDQ